MGGATVLERPTGGVAAPGLCAPAVDRLDRPAVRWIALGAFAVLTAVGIGAHTLWFDELQAWNIARASGSPAELWSNLRYEGHPLLWYVPLFVLTRVTGNPVVMQVLQWMIAVATAGLVLFRAPLRTAFRIALVAGYFLAFEYGVMSRSYGLGTLALVAALVLLARPSPRWAWGTAALVALACTSLPGAVLALAVAATVVCDRRLRAVRGARGLTVSVVVASAVVAITCIPPDDFGNLTPGIGDTSRFGSGLGVRVASSAAGVWRALVPLPATVGEWNTNLLDRQPGAVWVQALLSILVFAVVLAALRRRRFARRLWWVGSLALFAFFVVVTRPEAVRHAGFAFLLFVACVWCAHAPPGDADGAAVDRAGSTEPDRLGRLLIVVLAAQLLATVMVYPSASTEDFSRDRALAAAIDGAGLEAAIVSAQDWDATTIGGYLDVDVHSLARGERIRFVVTDTRQERGIARLDLLGVRCGAHAEANERGGPVALVVEGELAGQEPLVVSDGVAVYEVEPGPLPSACPTR